MRVYFDENFSPHLIKGFAILQDGRVREDVQVMSVAGEFGRGCPDETWIPAVARQHGVAVTQDMSINRTRAQWALCEANKIGVFFLKPPKAGWDYWEIINLTLKWWPQIKDTAKTSRRPFGRVIQTHASKWAIL